MMIAFAGLLLLAATPVVALDIIEGTIYSPFNRKCMDTHDDGMHITSTNCTNSPNHIFIFMPVDDTYYQIKSKENGKCVTVEDGSTANEKLIKQKACKPDDHFHFKLEGPVGDQFIRPKHSNSCIRIGRESEVGRHLMQFTCNAPRGQDKWCIGVCGTGPEEDDVMGSPSGSPPMSPAPGVTDKSAGGHADPHFRSWDGLRFDFHGACDITMIQSDAFGHGLGLDVHVRTALRDNFSFIERVAIRIGDDIFEVQGRDYWINGDDSIELPYKMAGKYNVQYIPSGLRGNKDPLFLVPLTKNSRITIGAFREFLAVWVRGSASSFGDSVGMLGEYHTGGFFGRDGMTLFDTDDMDSFGIEWQVKEEHDDPQILSHPEGASKECTFPSSTGRRLGANDPELLKAAESACEEQYEHPDDIKACVFDVMVTGDLEMATADQLF